MSAPTKEYVTSQPTKTAPMEMGGDRDALNRQAERNWSYGLCDCFSECELCCCAFWFPCIVYSKSKQHLQSLQNSGPPLAGGGDGYTGDCFLYTCLSLCGLSWALQMGTRASVRACYHIHSGCVCECCLSCWCYPCALTQEGREIELEERNYGGRYFDGSRGTSRFELIELKLGR